MGSWIRGRDGEEVKEEVVIVLMKEMSNDSSGWDSVVVVVCWVAVVFLAMGSVYMLYECSRKDSCALSPWSGSETTERKEADPIMSSPFPTGGSLCWTPSSIRCGNIEFLREPFSLIGTLRHFGHAAEEHNDSESQSVDKD